MAPNQTYHRTCHCGREFICGDAIENECRTCRTMDHAGDCGCIDCRLVHMAAPAHPTRWQDIDADSGFDGLGLCPKCHGAETRNGTLCVVCQNEARDDAV